jgi:hypothetical protein
MTSFAQWGIHHDTSLRDSSSKQKPSACDTKEFGSTMHHQQRDQGRSNGA